MKNKKIIFILVIILAVFIVANFWVRGKVSEKTIQNNTVEIVREASNSYRTESDADNKKDYSDTECTCNFTINLTALTAFWDTAGDDEGRIPMTHADMLTRVNALKTARYNNNAISFPHSSTVGGSIGFTAGAGTTFDRNSGYIESDKFDVISAQFSIKNNAVGEGACRLSLDNHSLQDSESNIQLVRPGQKSREAFSYGKQMYNSISCIRQ